MDSEQLLPWYRREARDLPWRRTRDPYAIWVSEIMLQQTRVAAVIPYYERFLRRFPDVGTLARAREETVLAHWSGLGYYRRARMLHAAARQAARDGVPTSYDGWRALPGIGDYTASAIASIAHGEAEPVVDGNVERVVSRYLAAHPDKRETRRRMESWIPADEPGDFNQAVMELGATVCLPRAPRCDACPIVDGCRGRHEPERYPAAKVRPKVREVERAVKLARSKGRVFLRRNEKTGVLEGMWDLPPSRGGGDALGEVRHGVLDRSYRISIHAGRATGTGRWFTPKQLESVPLATAARKCLRLVGFISA
ncbi:MAG: A/G-specific adenine glycosylase [Planctomycetota bacterium]